VSAAPGLSARPASATGAGWLPGPLVRGLLALAGVALLVAVVAPSAEGRTAWTSLLAGVALVAWVTASPTSPAPTILLLLALVVLLDAGPPPWPLLVVQAACLSAVHLLAALCGAAPPSARWETAALTPVLRRWLVVQACCLPLLVLAGVASSLGRGPGLEVAAGLLVLVVAGGLVALARRRR